MEQTEESESEAGSPEVSQQRPARWKRVVLILGAAFALLLIPLFVAAGPAFPTVARLAILKGAASQGIDGDCEISGSLFSGFAIRNVAMTGKDSPLTGFFASEIEVDYDFSQLLLATKSLDWLRLLRTKNVEVELTVPKATTEEEKNPPKDPSSIRTTEFSPLWNLLKSTIEIEQVSVTAHLEEATYRLTDFSLHHSPHAGGSLSIQSVQLPESEAFSDLATRITSGQRELTLGPFTGKEVESIHYITLTESEPGLWEVRSELELGKANIHVQASTAGEVSLTLPDQQVIDLSEIKEPGESPELRGEISDLDLTFRGDFANPSTWSLGGKLIGSQLGVNDRTLESLVVLLSGNQLSLEAFAPGLELTARASAPVDQLDSTARFSDLPIDLESHLEFSSVTDFLAAWAIDAPVSGELEAKLENLQLEGGRILRSGQLEVRSDSLTWGEHLFPWIGLTARVGEPDQVRIDAEVFPDNDRSNFLKGGADFDIPNLRYEGAVVGELLPKGSLGELLEELGLAVAGNLRWHGSGSLSPRVHTGAIELNLDEVVVQGARSMRVKLAADYSETSAQVSELLVQADPFDLQGELSWSNDRLSIESLIGRVSGVPKMNLAASIPYSLSPERAITEQAGEVLLDLDFSDFPVEEIFHLFSPEPPVAGRLNGSLGNEGTWEAMKATGDLTFHPRIEQTQGEPALSLSLDMSGAAMRPHTWNTDLKAVLSGLQWDDIQLEDLGLHVQTREERGVKWLYSTLQGNQEGASLSANARLDLSGTHALAELKEQPLAIDATLSIPELAPLWRQLAPPQWRNLTLAGAVQLDVQNALLEGSTIEDGSLHLFTDSLEIEGESIQRIEMDAKVTEPNAVTGELELRIDDVSHFEARGDFQLEKQAYRGAASLSLDLDSEGVLKRLLGPREIANLLPSSLAFSASASGSLVEATTSGEFNLSGAGLSFAEGAEPIQEFALEGEFSEESLDSSLLLKSQPLDLEGTLSWDGNRFGIDSLRAMSEGSLFFEARGSIPFSKDTLSPGDWFSSEEDLSISIVSEPASMATLTSLVHPSPPLDGDLDLDLSVSGSPARPDITLDLKVDDLSLPDQAKVKAGTLALSLRTENESAQLSGEYRHPDVNPFQIDASLPFYPRDWALNQRAIEEEPIQVSVKMDRSSLSFLSTQVPAIKSIEGVLALNAEVRGSLLKPVISGQGDLDVSRLRFQERNAPSLYDVDLKTRFDDNRLYIDRFKAIVAGGEVAAEGSISFLPDEEPNFDVRMGAREALLFRTPDLSLRTDAVLSLTGPWTAATIAGEVGLNNSRFFKNFDLLPSALPVRNTSALPTVERAPRGGGAAYTDLKVGVDIEPFRNWNADVRLFTKTPFQVRSNLVESDLVADLKVSGKLAAPVPRGFVAIDEGDLSLPFSSIDVEVGRIEFDEKTGFNGAINLKAKAKADKYRINVYLYNQILDPQYVLTSVPPMPSEDLLTLLVTGTTRSDLVGGDTGSLAASKAATLLLKNFQKASAKADSEPTLFDNLRERTELEIGGVNPETGAESIGGRIRLWKQLFFVGDVDSENDYRALLKYVFRFQ